MLGQPLARPLILTVAAFAAFACASAEPPSGASSPGSSSSSTGRPAREPGGAEPSGEATREDPVAAAFVAAHDRVRANVSPTADPPLAPVSWSPELAATAQAWAERCEFEHSRTDYGENLAARTDEADPAEVVGSWAAEVEHYDHRSNRCARGQVCGHYTQLVWRDSVTIGCGVARCTSAGPFGAGPWWSYVCNYAPAGNYQGEKPY